MSQPACWNHLDSARVEDDVYQAFDSRGRRLELAVVEQYPRLRGWRVVERYVSIEEAERQPSHQAELRDRLVEHLFAFDVDAAYLGGAALADLVLLTADRHGL